MDGAAFVRALRADPRFERTKVVLDSGLPEFVVREQFDAFDAFLRKPFKIETLLALIRTLLA